MAKTAPKNILFFFFVYQTATCFAVAGQINLNLNLTFPKFPAILIFGDSTVDTGNNNYIPTIFRCNTPPYGEDFPGRSVTGRCSDGILAPDMLASLLGLKQTIPPFLNPDLSDSDIITGVSFASAGSGYDERTTSLSNVISVPRQLPYFREYIRRLEGIMGKKEAKGILSRALVVVSAGTNDVVLTLPAMQMTVGQYQDFMLNEIRKFVKELYYLGCRKMLVLGLPPVGCLPLQLTLNTRVPSECMDDQNDDAKVYNEKLQRLLLQVKLNLPKSKIVYGDIFYPVLDMINKPQQYELVETRRGCCGTGILELGPLCTEQSPLCENPNQYLFFDSIHPTEAGYKIIVQKLAQMDIPKFA